MKTNVHLIPLSHYRAVGTAVLKRFGFSGAAVTDALDTAIYADTTGVHSHGLVKLHSLIKDVIRADPNARPKRIRGRLGSAVTAWDSKSCLGTTSARLAVDDVVAAIKRGRGIAMSSVNEATHFLMPAWPIKAAIDHNIIMLVSTTAGRSEVVPLGGRRRAVGTNPFTYVFPTGDGRAVIGDAATSAMSFGKLKLLKEQDVPLAPDMAVDANGDMTLDAKSAHSPLTAGRLGWMMSLLVELFAAAIGGSTPTLRGEFDKGPAGEKHNCAFLFIGIGLPSLEGGYACSRSQSENIAHVVRSILADAGGNVRLPGQRRFDFAALTSKYDGLLLPEAQARQLIELGCAHDIAGSFESLERVEIDASLLQ